MSEHQPREHDHLVEPLYAGIAPPSRKAPNSAPERVWPLWSFLGLCAAAIALRAWLLAA